MGSRKVLMICGSTAVIAAAALAVGGRTSALTWIIAALGAFMLATAVIAKDG